MKEFIKLTCCLATILTMLSCAKVTRVDFGLSQDKLEVEKSGGSFIITTAIRNLELSSINIMNSDGKWEIANAQPIFDGYYRIGMDYDWIHVEKATNPSNRLCELRISVAENKSGTGRRCSIGLFAGDSGKAILIVQK